MTRIAIRDTGCKVNKADSDAIRAALADLPVLFVRDYEEADIVIINACAVTAAAERDGRSAVYKAKRKGAQMVVLSGCMAARMASGLSEPLDDVQVFPGTQDRSDLISFLRKRLSSGNAAHGFRDENDAINKNSPYDPVSPVFARSRPFLKVQDGCDGKCSYCVIPFVRGPSKSLHEGEVMRAVARAADAGAAEVVLTGIDLASWGKEYGRSLSDLITSLLAMRTGMRFRLSSLEPHGLEPRLAELFASSQDLCPHLHIPLQSGSDAILEKMRRPYRVSDFVRKIEMFVKLVPSIAFGYDVICGFPGETEADFEATYRLLKNLPLSYLHVFPYSPRPGTAAANMRGTVSFEVRSARCAGLRDLSAAARKERASSHVGDNIEVVDIRAKDKFIECLSADYIRVQRIGDPKPGRYLVKIVTSRGSVCIAGPEARS